ncbi:MAG: hypothetical protein KIT10_11835 [Flavobacteriales bacterium]|nr:hypothetical protein [Flavobacteriales bacterium]
MRSEPLLFVLLAPALLTSCGDSGPRDDVAEVRASYAAYIEALHRQDGTRASSLVDSRTVSYYDGMLTLAREADSAQVAGLDMMDKLTVLGMRMQSTPEQLRDMDGWKAVAAAVESGAMGGEGLEGLELGSVTVEGERARAPLTMMGFPTPAVFHFQREGDAWRIDLTSLFQLSRGSLDMMARSSGKPVHEHVHELLEMTAGRPVPEGIWHPVR